MIPSLFGLLVMLAGLVMIHYGLTDTLLPLTPVQPPPQLTPIGAQGLTPLGSSGATT